MKKYILVIGLLATTFITAHAQLKVESSGSIVAGTKLQNASFFTQAFQAGLSSPSQTNNAAIFAEASYPSYSSSNNKILYGVYGYANNAYGGNNFGVVGAIGYGKQGAGVFGATSNVVNTSIGGTYAGYFNGNTRVVGTLTATSVVQQSDIRLKDNITAFGQDGSILKKLLDMNVIEYNYKNLNTSLTSTDSASMKAIEEMSENLSQKKHIGLCAQELQQLFPELVEEGQDGYLGINYIELVPVLIRAIQELKEELESTKSDDAQRKQLPQTTRINMTSASESVLYQNTPNPFKEATTIRFSLAEGVKDAAICIFDMTGKMLKRLPVTYGMTETSVYGYELGEGLFLYSLIINGQEVDTKRMVITK